MTALWSSTKIAFLAPVALAADGSRVHSVKARGGSFNNTRTLTPPRVPGTEGDDVTRCEGDDVFDNKFLVALECIPRKIESGAYSASLRQLAWSRIA
jgi:hypothetical protein